MRGRPPKMMRGAQSDLMPIPLGTPWLQALNVKERPAPVFMTFLFKVLKRSLEQVQEISTDPWHEPVMF
ncbi:hypothetical protein C1632_05400 [Microbacterium testaceum]|nr:hypothetical protein C1632_05400 [Microbacterium testaceum]